MCFTPKSLKPGHGPVPYTTVFSIFLKSYYSCMVVFRMPLKCPECANLSMREDWDSISDWEKHFLTNGRKYVYML